MTIKPQILLRFLLLLPYFAWGIALSFVFLVITPAGNTGTTNAVVEALGGVATIYMIGIVLWGIPYTILAIGFFLWSIRKPASSMYKAFLLSPLLLSILMAVEVAIVSFWPQQVGTPTGFSDFLSYLLVVVIPSLLFGYVFVGLGVIIYKLMGRFDLIRSEQA